MTSVLPLLWTGELCGLHNSHIHLLSWLFLQPPSMLDMEITIFSFLCSGLLSSDYVEIHYENGKPQYSKVWSAAYGHPIV